MSIKNLILAVFNQLTRPNAFRNIFVTRNAFGIFSVYSHVSRRIGMPKVAYLSMHDALSAADLMCCKYGAHYSVYKCAWCNGWHIGKNNQNKLPNISETATGVLPVVKKMFFMKCSNNFLFQTWRLFTEMGYGDVHCQDVVACGCCRR